MTYLKPTDGTHALDSIVVYTVVIVSLYSIVCELISEQRDDDIEGTGLPHQSRPDVGSDV